MVLLGYATGTAWFDLVQLIQFPPRPAAVTFMFDDGNKSTVTQAKPILTKYGFPGSAAIVESYVNSAGFVTAQDLRNLQPLAGVRHLRAWRGRQRTAGQGGARRNAGWDIASHSVDHNDLTELSDAAVRRS